MSVIRIVRTFIRARTESLSAFILVISTCLCSTANGQKEFGFKMPEKVNQITIPFNRHNNLIIIPITINRFITLKFVLDTGVETAILTEKLYADILDVNYIRQITIAGPGIIDSVEALVTNRINFSLPGGILGQNMSLLVLKEDYLKLSESIGDDVHGIIGYDIFSRFIVDINYDDNILTLIRPNKFKRKRNVTEVPIEIRGSKPFVSATIKQDNQWTDLNVMIDTGASHAALIDYNYLDGVSLPEEKIVTKLGRGIAGEIPGYVGRMDSVQIDCFAFDDMLVSAPFDGAYNKVIKRGARIGTFGGELLTRFRVIFDYPHHKLYLRKGGKYYDAFEYDMSGMTLNAVGRYLDTLKVVAIDENSPASTVGILKEDVILSINGRNLRTHKLSDIYQLLRSRDGRRIKMKIFRDGEKLKKNLFLRRVI